ncbi:unnamed protein product [Allacma fusca]|uniref:ribonuclease H n=1 Tax=Allacma fusca TaxID=39272 RepID=A0A8J2KRT2_9HEXA|nr:unnamed protein product [Allacma fusca]
MSWACMRNKEGSVICYTDGACSYNGQKGAQAGIGVHFGRHHMWNIFGRLKSKYTQTSNTAEIRAAVEAIALARFNGEFKLEIRSDSILLVRGMNEWIYSWMQNGWMTSKGYPVINREEFWAVMNEVKLMDSVIFVYVPRKENKEADELAKQGASYWCDY